MNRLATLVVMALFAAPVLGAPVEVWIDKPRSSGFVFGDVDFEATVNAEEAVALVQFLLDGKVVAEFVHPPYRMLVDVGFENEEHEFRVVAKTTSGLTGEAVMVTAALHVDEAVDVGLQQLYITVSDGGKRVQGLGSEDFKIYDQGDRQEIVTFERGDIPLTAALLLDCSLSMEKGERLEAALRGAKVFLEAMNKLDRARVMLFSGRLLRETASTDDVAELAASLESVTPVGGTAINDHLYMSLSNLEREQGRRVVVMLSDGEDVHSVLEMRDVLQKARHSQALIYWIYLREEGAESELPTYTTSWRDLESNRREAKLLRETVRESGGRIEIVESVEDLDAAFAGIIDELREQYVIGYYPSADRGDGSWHKVKVNVKHPSASVRTRGGYYDY